jgi:hypothetical protein
MATGFEDYIVYFVTQPALALQRCQQHLMALMEMTGVKTLSDTVGYDPATLEQAIARCERHLISLQMRVNGFAQPRLMPTRRYDPGPNVGISGANGTGGGP